MDIPASLTIIWALSRGLKEEPLVKEVFLGTRGVRECVRFVVLSKEILDYGTGLPEDDTSIWVLDGYNQQSVTESPLNALEKKVSKAYLVHDRWGLRQ